MNQNRPKVIVTRPMLEALLRGETADSFVNEEASQVIVTVTLEPMLSGDPPAPPETPHATWAHRETHLHDVARMYRTRAIDAGRMMRRALKAHATVVAHVTVLVDQLLVLGDDGDVYARGPQGLPVELPPKTRALVRAACAGLGLEVKAAPKRKR